MTDDYCIASLGCSGWVVNYAGICLRREIGKMFGVEIWGKSLKRGFWIDGKGAKKFGQG